MIDSHIHIFHDNNSHYTVDVIYPFIEQAGKIGLDEIYLLEHTHQFSDFREMYQPVADYNEYQKNWLDRKMKASLNSYLHLIEAAKACHFPIKVRFGLEICYIPETKDILKQILNQYPWDFLTGSVHYIDGWGFDHKAEFWEGVEVDWAYHRYYE
ncbi:MAG TPA: PHP domain-containing protein, partial [Bacillota bacterium]|nr:PHP domain-containing protein [Bacillota bacterium]